MDAHSSIRYMNALVAYCLFQSLAFQTDPLIIDLPRFPQTVAYDNWLFAVEFCDRLEHRIAYFSDESEELSHVLAQAKYFRDAWDKLDDLCRPGFPPEKKRCGAVQLRRLIGEANFAAGLMPPVVPYHCCAQMYR